jgi:hypothetical protein
MMVIEISKRSSLFVCAFFVTDQVGRERDTDGVELDLEPDQLKHNQKFLK